jgi:hypothetical protein
LRNLIFIFVLLFPASLKAQPADSLVLHSVSDEISDEAQIESKFEPDTLAVQQKSFDLTEIDKLKADSDLNYKQPPTVVETLWDRFKRWLSWLLNSLFETAATTDMGNLIIYIIAAIIVIAAIMALLKVNAFKVFYSGADQAKQNYSVFHENIHEMDFDKLINEAVERKQLRLATRLVFLHALKILSDKHLIDFNPGKTNHDYVEELSSSDLKTGLNELSFYFDYAWYGNFSISEDQFLKIKNVFSDWKNKVTE